MDYIKVFARRFTKSDISSLAAQMTYFLVLAFIPVLMVAISISSRWLVPESILGYLEFILPESAVLVISNVINELIASNISYWTLLFSLWLVSRGLRSIMNGLSKSYIGAPPRNYIKHYLMSLVFAVLFVILIVLCLVIIVFGRYIMSYLFDYLTIGSSFESVWGILKYIIVFSLITVVFCMIFSFAPSIKLKFKDVIIGALFTSIGWIVMSLAFSFYVGHSSRFGVIYGSLGGLFILLIWLYLSTIILLIGNEINATIFLFRYMPQEVHNIRQDDSFEDFEALIRLAQKKRRRKTPPPKQKD